MSADWPVVVLDAPSNLGLKPQAPGREPGVRRMAAALRATGLLQRLGAEDGGLVPPPPYSAAVDPGTRVRNGPAIRAYSLALAAALGPLLETDRFPLVLGGDCSILLGSLLALRRRGRYGLAYFDGHTDFATPDTSPSGGAAGMDLALACGHGPEELTTLDGLTPLIRESDVLLFAHRDVEDPTTYRARAIFDSDVRRHDLGAFRRGGVSRVVRDGLKAIGAEGARGIWIHVDVDVLDSTFMPAVDSPQPGGLRAAELVEALRAALATGLAVGMQVTIFDPDLDPGGQLARALADLLVEALQEVGR